MPNAHAVRRSLGVGEGNERRPPFVSCERARAKAPVSGEGNHRWSCEQRSQCSFSAPVVSSSSSSSSSDRRASRCSSTSLLFPSLLFALLLDLRCSKSSGDGGSGSRQSWRQQQKQLIHPVCAPLCSFPCAPAQVGAARANVAAHSAANEAFLPFERARETVNIPELVKHIFSRIPSEKEPARVPCRK